MACKIRIFGALRLRRERGAIVFGDGGKGEDEDAEPVRNIARVIQN